jgi:hypothetical protein
MTEFRAGATGQYLNKGHLSFGSLGPLGVAWGRVMCQAVSVPFSVFGRILEPLQSPSMQIIPSLSCNVNGIVRYGAIS